MSSSWPSEFVKAEMYRDQRLFVSVHSESSSTLGIMKSLLDLKLPCENIRIFLCHGATSVNHQFICVILVHEMA